MGKNYARVEMQENKLEPGKSRTAGCGKKEWVVKHRYTCTQVDLGDVLSPVQLQDARTINIA